MNRNNMTVIRKERRRDRRRALELEALLDGQAVSLVDLSASGFGAALDATDSGARGFRIGSQHRLELQVGDNEPLDLSVEITRWSPAKGIVAGTFLEISDSAYNTIESLLTGRFRRRS
jgi:hypothetical protein